MVLRRIMPIRAAADIGNLPENASVAIDSLYERMVAEMERKFILERQRTGIEAAKAKGGIYKGRKPSVPVEDVRRLHGEGKGAIAEALGVSRMSVWRQRDGAAGTRSRSPRRLDDAPRLLCIHPPRIRHAGKPGRPGRLPNHHQGNADAPLAGSGAAGRRDLALRIGT
jgi:hypothetical protein